MAIRKRTARDPFLDRESAIKALQDFMDGTRVTRKGMYLLQVINSYVQDGKRIFERIPQEVFSGLPGGSRRNVQAAALCRAQGTADAPQPGELLESGYTREQEVIGLWAERDGCWSDTPEEDQTRKGRLHRAECDGSEARIFYDGGATVHKTIVAVRYNSLERFLDRVAIHNAIFPEATMTIDGFGVRDYSNDHTDFCAIVSQPFIEGTVPTQEQIDESMRERGLREPSYSAGSGFYLYETPSSSVLVTDVHDNNCVLTPKGKVVVFDCEAMVNDVGGFGGKYVIPPLQYDETSVRSIKNKIEMVTPISADKEFVLDSLSPEGRKDLLWKLSSPDVKAVPVPDGELKGHLIQQDPDDPGKYILALSPQVQAYLLAFGPKLDDGLPVTEKECARILEGKPFERAGIHYRYDLDKGRAEQFAPTALRLRKNIKTSQTISL